MFFVYMMRCKDNSLYTGITTDVKRRFIEHTQDNKKGAKYTRARTPISVDAVWSAENRSSASKLEAFIKCLTKKEKEALIGSPDLILEKYKEKLGENIYKPIDYEDK